jgi:hypothetical protein
MGDGSVSCVVGIEVVDWEFEEERGGGCRERRVEMKKEKREKRRWGWGEGGFGPRRVVVVGSGRDEGLSAEALEGWFWVRGEAGGWRGEVRGSRGEELGGNDFWTRLDPKPLTRGEC